MKTSSLRKVIIPSFALLIGGSLAASLTSTLAWFQYSTTARVAYVDALSHCSKLLKISVDGGSTWGYDFYQDDMASHISGNHLVPITTGPQTKDSALTYYDKVISATETKPCVKFYNQPDFGRGGDYTNWVVAKDNSYAQFTILVKVNDVDGGSNATLVNDVYLTKLIIQDDATNGATNDLSEAVRVHLSVTDASATPVTKNFLFAKGRGTQVANDVETSVGSCLDLNNDGAYDKDIDNFGTYAIGDVVIDDQNHYYQCIDTVGTPTKNIDYTGEGAHWKAITPAAFSETQSYVLNDVVLHNDAMYKCNKTDGLAPGSWNEQYWTLVNPTSFYCVYGVKGEKQTAYSNENPNLIVEKPDSPLEGTTPVSLGKTGSTNMKIVVTTWIEGWTELDNGLSGNAHQQSGNSKDKDTAVWDPALYVNKRFNVGIRLGVKSHDTDHQA